MSKAWKVYPNTYEYVDVVFADTRNKARYIAQEFCDGFDNLSYTDIYARRLPKADCMCKDRIKMDWFNPEDRLFLVENYGFSCGDILDLEECKYCNAKHCCPEYIEYMERMEEYNNEIT